MRWTGQIFWLLVFEKVERFQLIVERPRKASASLNSQLSTLNCLLLLPAFTAPASAERLAIGKLYPVTAAQLLPIHTGFLAPIHILSRH
jgi:hypothetical protein